MKPHKVHKDRHTRNEVDYYNYQYLYPIYASLGDTEFVFDVQLVRNCDYHRAQFVVFLTEELVYDDPDNRFIITMFNDRQSMFRIYSDVHLETVLPIAKPIINRTFALSEF